MRHIQREFIVVALLAGWLTSGHLAGAQSEMGAIDVVIRVYLCEADPGSIGLAMGSDPEGCVRVDGVTVGFATVDGVHIGACITEGGFCLVPAPIGADLVVTEDLGTVPGGIGPARIPSGRPRTRSSRGQSSSTSPWIKEPARVQGPLAVVSRRCRTPELDQGQAG